MFVAKLSMTTIELFFLATEGGITLVGRLEVIKLVVRIDYHVPEKTRGG